MRKTACRLVDYFYRRSRGPGSDRWALRVELSPPRPVRWVPGLVGHGRDPDRVSIVYAVPCSPAGEIEAGTYDEYGAMAAERFRQLVPGQTVE